MESLLMTLALLLLMAVALIALARSWPRSSRKTGYRISTGKDSAGEPGPAADEEPPTPEDDDVHWHWTNRP